MKKLNFHESEKMIKNINYDTIDPELMKMINEMLIFNMKWNGVKLLQKIMDYRKLSYKNIYEITGITQVILNNILNKRVKITYGSAENLSKLGYPRECFLKK